MTGLEPVASCLASRRSTIELHLRKNVHLRRFKVLVADLGPQGIPAIDPTRFLMRLLVFEPTPGLEPG